MGMRLRHHRSADCLWEKRQPRDPWPGQTPKTSNSSPGSSCHSWQDKGPGLGLHQNRWVGKSKNALSNLVGCIQPAFHGSGAISQKANSGWWGAGGAGDLASRQGSASCWLCGPGHVYLSSLSFHFPTSKHRLSAELNNRCKSPNIGVGIYNNGFFFLVYFLLKIT